MNNEHQEEYTASSRLDYYLKKRDYDLEYSDDRLKLFEEIDEDSVIIKHLDSDTYINSQVKRKRDRLSELDPLLRKLDAMAYYILKSEFRNEEHKEKFEEDVTGEVLNNTGENNLAYKKDKSLKESDRSYGYPVMSVYAMNRNRRDAPTNRKREVFAVNEFKKRFGSKKEVLEEEVFDTLNSDTRMSTTMEKNPHIYDRIIYALREPENVLLFLRVEYEVLSEIDGDPSSEYYLISHILEDVYNSIGLSTEEHQLLAAIKDGNTYEEIRNKVNYTGNQSLSLSGVKYRVHSLCEKISSEIKEKVLEVMQNWLFLGQVLSIYRKTN